MRELRERGNVNDVELRIADGLDVDEARALRKFLCKILYAVARCVAHRDAVLREIAEQRARAAIEAA